MNDTRVRVVIRDNANQFWEVIPVPFTRRHRTNGQRADRSNVHVPNTHRERVDILVELIEQGDGLDDHVVHSVDVEFYFGSRVGVT